MQNDANIDLRIRPAVASDIPILRSFEQDLINVERAFDVDLLPSGLTYYDLEGLIHSDDSQVIIAERNSSLLACGYAQIRTAKPIYHHAQVAYLGFLYVVPAGRGQGLVQQIIDSLVVWARSKNLSHLELGVYSQNAAAIAAYERAGFSAISQTMVLTLSD